MNVDKRSRWSGVSYSAEEKKVGRRVLDGPYYYYKDSDCSSVYGKKVKTFGEPMHAPCHIDKVQYGSCFAAGSVVYGWMYFAGKNSRHQK